MIHNIEDQTEYVLVPYQEFLSSWLTSQLAATEATVPNAIVNRVLRLAGFTQAEVAELAGTSQASYAQTENRQRPRRSTLRKIAKAMGLAYEQLGF